MKLFDRIRLKGRSDKPSIVADSMVSDRWLSTTVTDGSDYTISPSTRSEDHSGRIYVANATGAFTFILPDPSVALNGYHYKFVNLADETLTVQCDGKIVASNNAAADTVTLQTSKQLIGAELVAWCNGTYWFVTRRGTETLVIA